MGSYYKNYDVSFGDSKLQSMKETQKESSKNESGVSYPVMTLGARLDGISSTKDNQSSLRDQTA